MATHSFVDSGWREVADTALAFVSAATARVFSGRIERALAGLHRGRRDVWAAPLPAAAGMTAAGWSEL